MFLCSCNGELFTQAKIMHFLIAEHLNPVLTITSKINFQQLSEAMKFRTKTTKIDQKCCPECCP